FCLASKPVTILFFYQTTITVQMVLLERQAL
ncbi:MAG: hypothetical protein ACJAR1_001882, partial [Rubritalea sp.]